MIFFFVKSLSRKNSIITTYYFQILVCLPEQFLSNFIKINDFFFILQLVPVGARLAEMARIRLQYDETRQQVQDIQQVI